MVASSAILSSYLPPLQLGTEKGGPTTPSISFPLGKRFARTRLSLVVKSTTNSDGEIDGDENKVLVKDDGDSSFKPFGFVNDNPSSRSAIQLPASPAEDGNVGEMLYVCMDYNMLLFHLFFPLFVSHLVHLCNSRDFKKYVNRRFLFIFA